MSFDLGQSDDDLAADLGSLRGQPLRPEFLSSLDAAIAKATDAKAADGDGKVIPFSPERQMENIPSRTGSGIRFPRWASAAAVALMGGLTALMFTQESNHDAPEVLTAGVGSVDLRPSKKADNHLSGFSLTSGESAAEERSAHHRYSQKFVESLHRSDADNPPPFLKIGERDQKAVSPPRER